MIRILMAISKMQLCRQGYGQKGGAYFTQMKILCFPAKRKTAATAHKTPKAGSDESQRFVCLLGIEQNKNHSAATMDLDVYGLGIHEASLIFIPLAEPISQPKELAKARKKQTFLS